MHGDQPQHRRHDLRLVRGSGAEGARPRGRRGGGLGQPRHRDGHGHPRPRHGVGRDPRRGRGPGGLRRQTSPGRHHSGAAAGRRSGRRRRPGRPTRPRDRPPQAALAGRTGHRALPDGRDVRALLPRHHGLADATDPGDRHRRPALGGCRHLPAGLGGRSPPRHDDEHPRRAGDGSGLRLQRLRHPLAGAGTGLGPSAAPVLRDRPDRGRPGAHGAVARAQGQEAHGCVDQVAGPARARDRTRAAGGRGGRRTGRRGRRRRPRPRSARGERPRRRHRDRRPVLGRRVDAHRRERPGREGGR